MQVYGNLMNRIMEGSSSVVPEVGMGCTISMYSDRHAATIVEVKGKKIAVQEDISTRVDKNGMSECQDYEYSADKSAPIRWFSLRKTGRWIEVKSSTGLILNHRDTYHDYGF